VITEILQGNPKATLMKPAPFPFFTQVKERWRIFFFRYLSGELQNKAKKAIGVAEFSL